MKTLLMLGDSLVEWGDWPTLLPEYNVINRGMAGECTEGLAGRLIDEINSTAEPDAVLIQSGTNNLLMGSPHFPAIHSSMVPTIRTFYPSCSIIISSLMPMSIIPSHKLEEINKQLQEITTQTENCFYLDMVPPFNEKCLPITKPGFLNDQVHLSTRGYQVWAEEIATFLQDVLQ
ncbi:GDSL-type esterase/lipase family protein [Desulfogranum marinum]|uniref:GDSL-type esterase/lipase family protein n=1 Tax=Desulfogranum marinum TaxID=453220 RepID=UPI001962F76F|nr:GDSL-type esterase/lipase family protein [Desulfogranum marinum]MBM9511851.1 hypothetical protein [Desulfogranum marinum]